MGASNSGSRHKPGGTIPVDMWMWVGIGAATLLFFCLTYLKFSNFNGATHDTAVVSFAFDKAVQGQFLPLYYRDGSLLGNHPGFVLLVWLPVYFVWRSFYSLHLYQSFMLAVSAWPLYLLAKDVLKNERAALLVGLVFLLFPTIAATHMGEIHEDAFGLPFIMAAFYFMHRQNFRWFALAIVLACLAKETMVLKTAAFGLYALWLRRPAKWVVFPVGFSVAYFALAMFLLTTVFAGSGAVLYTKTRYFEAYGLSPSEVLNTWLTQPGKVWEVMRALEKPAYVGKLLLPVLFVLPFLSPAIIVSLPDLLMNVVSSNPALTVIQWHYGIILGGTLMAASVFGIERVARWFPSAAERVRIGLAVAMLVAAVFSLQFWFRTQEYTEKPYTAAQRKVVESIPRDASVISPSPMVAHFSRNPKITTVGFIFDRGTEHIAEYDYIVLDANWARFVERRQGEMAEWLRGNDQFQLIFAEEGIFLFENRRRRQRDS